MTEYTQYLLILCCVFPALSAHMLSYANVGQIHPYTARKTRTKHNFALGTYLSKKARTLEDCYKEEYNAFEYKYIYEVGILYTEDIH